ncbi:MAG: hypothetical protein ABIV43_01270 [Candidatus Saccharimonadales bacterium]
MDSLFNLLGNKNFDEPPESASVKKFVDDEYHAVVSVQVRDKDIVVTSASAALVSTLRLRSPEIKRRCQLTKRLVFRIGS